MTIIAAPAAQKGGTANRPYLAPSAAAPTNSGKDAHVSKNRLKITDTKCQRTHFYHQMAGWF